MKSYTTIIVDDSEIDRLSLQACLSNFIQFKVVGVFESAELALSRIDSLEADVLFCDIQMPGINGLEFRKQVEKIPVCVFISYSPDYAAETFELETLDYIVKPLTNNRFLKTVERIETFFEIKNKASMLDAMDGSGVIFIKEGNEQVKINIFDILYLEALRDYTKITTKQASHYILSTLGALLKTEEFSNFIRIHRSYAVQKVYIQKIKTNQIVLQNNVSVPVGRTYKEIVENQLLNKG